MTYQSGREKYCVEMKAMLYAFLAAVFYAINIPELLWKNFPDYAVLRRKDTDKWYALVARLTAAALAGSFLRNPSYYKAKGHDALEIHKALRT